MLVQGSTGIVMLMLLKVFFICLLARSAQLARSAHSKGFSYRDPDTWGDDFPTCDGSNQSPVQIPWRMGDIVDVADGLLKWNNYQDVPDSMTLTNTGHSVQVSLKWPSDYDTPYLSGGPLNGEYVIEQFHFHWGQNDYVGSEHTLDGISTAMELHMVHWKRDYGSFAEASKNPDGIAVVGAFFNPIVARSSRGIEQVWKYLEDVQRESGKKQLSPFPLTDFEVVQSGEKFVSYFGSLTTPGCNEAVTWLLALDLFSVTSDELDRIRSVELANGDDHNYRNVQPRNGRSFEFYQSN